MRKDGAGQYGERYVTADVNQKLILNLRDISHTMRSLYEGKGSQKQVLMVLLQTGRITQRELTQRLGIQPGSASEVIAKLEHAGLLVRVPGAEDRRTADVMLTEEGTKQATQAALQRERRHEQMFACLSDAEKAELLALLEKVNRDWDARYRQEPEKDGLAQRRECPCLRGSKATDSKGRV